MKFLTIIAAATARSFDVYLKALSKDEDPAAAPPNLLRIGQLAKMTGETNATIRFWTKEGLLQVADTTGSGYQLYTPAMIGRAGEIRQLQRARFTLAEIASKLS